MLASFIPLLLSGLFVGACASAHQAPTTPTPNGESSQSIPAKVKAIADLMVEGGATAEMAGNQLGGEREVTEEGRFLEVKGTHYRALLESDDSSPTSKLKSVSFHFDSAFGLQLKNLEPVLGAWKSVRTGKTSTVRFQGPEHIGKKTSVKVYVETAFPPDQRSTPVLRILIR